MFAKTDKNDQAYKIRLVQDVTDIWLLAIDWLTGHWSLRNLGTVFHAALPAQACLDRHQSGYDHSVEDGNSLLTQQSLP